MSNFKLMLASTSRYKQQQLQQLKLPFEICDPHVDEDHSRSDNAEQLAMLLAAQKAEAVSSQFPEHWVIGSDQTAITADGYMLNKPLNKEKAFEQLSLCQGQSCYFYSAVSLINKALDARQCWSIKTEVNFRDLSAAEIQRYIELDDPLYCAGSFKIESLGISLFKSVRSDDPSALIGLPLLSLCNQLRHAGFALP
ncbi:Maf family protein [Reinekea thalattae]|uniref:7-methyl-GTP pyrophosphatase n=1 Tax=Reinekea thalattae TaxID=2593301 RepID=A0A5C8Z6I5_9GAMM|nr:Maf family protein [Reinekea thalattae]TXR53522.1 septum formation protein Maf [Reinekea thalattae]